MRVALLGTRGIPARYGGFETFAEELSARLVARGHQVTVYTRKPWAVAGVREWRGARVRTLPAWSTKALETLSHTFFSCLDPQLASFQVVLLCNAANAPFIPLLHARGLPVALNVDGLERKRRKWGFLGKNYYLLCERLAARWADAVVSDAQLIVRYYRRLWGRDTAMIPYGGDLPPPQSYALLDQLGLGWRQYLLYVSRFEPENNPDRVAEAYGRVFSQLPLVLVGSAPYAPRLEAKLRQAALGDRRLVLPGAIYGEGYRQLMYGALAYIHATEVGGTHPALVEAMGAGQVVFFLDNLPNREVVGGAGIPFRFDRSPTLAERLGAFLSNPEAWEDLRTAARGRVEERYTWDRVADAYERLLEELCSRKA